MKFGRKLTALLAAILMLAAFVPSQAGEAETNRPLTVAEREAKLAELNDFAEEFVSLKNRYGSLRAEGDESAFASARIIVKYRGKLETKGALASVSGHNDWHVIQYASPEKAKAACEEYANMKGVLYAEPDIVMKAFATPGSNSFNSWGFNSSNVDAYNYNEWIYSHYGSNLDNIPEVVVAVIDTGADQDHPYLSGRLVPGYNFVDGTNNPEDGHSHGTHVSGTIVDGTLANVKIMPIKVLSDTGYGTMTDVALGMEYGYLNGCLVENLSLGGGCEGLEAETHYLMEEIINAAFDNGTTVCIAAGNDSVDAAGFCPANVGRACTVAAINSSHSLAYFSNYGPYVDIAAPGVSIYSSVPGGGFGSKDGTSMACPHVAAVAAMIKSYRPDMSADSVVAVIKGAAVDIGISNAGTGMLNVTDLFNLDPYINAPGQNNHFTSSGSNPWRISRNTATSGNSGVNSSVSVLESGFDFLKGQTVTFDYMVSSEEGHDFLRMKANGQVLFETSGEHGWQTVTVEIPGSGWIPLAWEYSKDASGASGTDKACIRNVKIEKCLDNVANEWGGEEHFDTAGEYPWIVDEAASAARSGNAGADGSSSVMTVSVELRFAMKIQFSYKVSADDGDKLTVKINGRNVLTSGATEGFEKFEYTVPVTGVYDIEFSYVKDGEGASGSDCAWIRSFKTAWTFESAANGTDDLLPFINDADYPWIFSGDCIRSSNSEEGNSESYLTLELEMQAGETLTFKYSVSSEANYDKFFFYVDGVQKLEKSGQVAWTTYTFTATSTKTYSFKWSYKKDSSVDSYEDCAKVKEVTYSGVYGANGDANDDGVVDSADALLVIRWSMGLISEDQINLRKANVNRDGAVDSADALIIIRRSMGLE
ncbi:MAG: S8 family serine peptidase [Clostridiales bacterium]|nr:S8 family serine peptidase [Clostridiales bacterium]